MSYINVTGMKIKDDSKEARILNSVHEASAPRPNGLKEFNINGQIVWALNYRNAVRKAAKL